MTLWICKGTQKYITEGRPPGTWPLAEWDWQCSRHANREHICQVPFGTVSGEVSAGGGEGEEENVPGGMPTAE